MSCTVVLLLSNVSPTADSADVPNHVPTNPCRPTYDPCGRWHGRARKGPPSRHSKLLGGAKTNMTAIPRHHWPLVYGPT